MDDELWMMDNGSLIIVRLDLTSAALRRFFLRLLFLFASRGCANCVFFGSLLIKRRLSDIGCLSNNG